NFKKAAGAAKAAGGVAKAHAPAGAKVAEAHGAAAPPSNDTESQADAAQVDQMAGAKAGVFDKAAFIAAVRKAIEANTPKTLDDADKLKESGKTGSAKGELKQIVGTNKEQSQGDIKAATDAPPDQGKAVPKPVTPMPPETPGAPPAPVPAAG